MEEKPEPLDYATPHNRSLTSWNGWIIGGAMVAALLVLLAFLNPPPPKPFPPVHTGPVRFVPATMPVVVKK